MFDAIHKTMPCRWYGKTILVMDEVSIAAPYVVGSCTAAEPHRDVLERVRKVLHAERQRLGYDSDPL